MTCYNPDGQENRGLSPCDPKAPVSACCRDSDVCLSSGYCFSAGLSALVRRGCTDKSFNSTECPQDCLTGPFKDFADVVITPCNSIYTFCCGNDKAGRECCNAEGNDTFRIDAGSPPQSIASVISTTTFTVTSTATSSAVTVSVTAADSGDVQAQKNLARGLGAGLGALSVLAIVAAGLVYFMMRKKVAKKQATIDEQAKGNFQSTSRGA